MITINDNQSTTTTSKYYTPFSPQIFANLHIDFQDSQIRKSGSVRKNPMADLIILCSHGIKRVMNSELFTYTFVVGNHYDAFFMSIPVIIFGCAIGANLLPMAHENMTSWPKWPVKILDGTKLYPDSAEIKQEGQDGPSSLTRVFVITLAIFLSSSEKNFQEFLYVYTVQVTPIH